jgi:hypothetical protein
MNSTVKDDIADPILYRLYFGFMLKDILHKIGENANDETKRALHEFHKKTLGFLSIANESQEVVSMFLFSVCVYWAVEHGIFVRTKENQPIDIENRPLSEVWQYL